MKILLCNVCKSEEITVSITFTAWANDPEFDQKEGDAAVVNADSYHCEECDDFCQPVEVERFIGGDFDTVPGVYETEDGERIVIKPEDVIAESDEIEPVRPEDMTVRELVENEIDSEMEAHNTEDRPKGGPFNQDGPFDDPETEYSEDQAVEAVRSIIDEEIAEDVATGNDEESEGLPELEERFKGLGGNKQDDTNS